MKLIIKGAPVFLLLVLLAACGGGGGGGDSPPPPPNNQMSVNFDTSAQDPNHYAVDRPYVTVYIVNASGVQMPFNLLLDTGATGVLINESALQAAGVTLPDASGQNRNICGQFADTTMYGGYLWNSPGISTLSSGGLSMASGFLVAVNQDTSPDSGITYTCSGTSGGPAFPTDGFIQGDFGMGLSPSWTFGSLSDTGPNPPGYNTPSMLPAGHANGFMLQFTPVSVLTGYSDSGSGTLTFGLDTSENNNSTAGYSFFPSDNTLTLACPALDASFGGIINNPYYDPGDTGIQNHYTAFFDTGSNFMFMDDEAMENATGIANISSPDNNEYTLLGYYIVDGGLLMKMGLYNGAGLMNSPASYDGRAAFITSPDSGNDEFPIALVNTAPPGNGYLIFVNDILDLGLESTLYGGLEDIGMPYMFNYPMYWAAPISATGEGWGIGINFSQ